MLRAGTGTIRAAVAGVATGLLVTGCLGGGGGSGGSGDGRASGEEGAGQPTGAEQQVPASPSAQDILEAPAVATGTLTDGDQRLQVEIISLRRTSERMARLDLRVTAQTDTNSILTSYFGNVENADGMSLIDGDAGKKYMVVRDSEGACLCTSGRSSLTEGEPVTVYAYFPAPPTSTEAVDVEIPNMVPFDDVPIAG